VRPEHRNNPGEKSDKLKELIGDRLRRSSARGYIRTRVCAAAQACRCGTVTASASPALRGTADGQNARGVLSEHAHKNENKRRKEEGKK
jgi:hypothetical protein